MDKGLLQPVSIKIFVSIIMRQYVEKKEFIAKSFELYTGKQKQGTEAENVEFVSYGYDSGWLEESDILERDSLIERKTASRIVHQFMRIELKETDEDNISAARKLQDLYDCRSCAGHVMQVYTKGIMDGYVDQAGRYLFGMGDKISVKEAQEIACRLFLGQNRKVQILEADVMRNAEMITIEEALYYFHTDKNAEMIDVRTNHDYLEKHLEGAKNVPFAVILKNPYVVSSRHDQMILLYCEEGYQSEIAANCLKEAGYEKVMYFAWKSNGEVRDI